MELRIGRFLVSFEGDFKLLRYEEPDFYGVVIRHDGWIYDVLCNRGMGERIIISGEVPGPHAYHYRDMPFHMGTASFLPAGVTARLA